MSRVSMNKNTSLGIFNQRLKELRLSTGLTQTQFAEKVGLSKTAMTNYENLGKTPSLDTALAIANSYNVSMDWLCGLQQQGQLRTQGDIAKLLHQLVSSGEFRIKTENVFGVVQLDGRYNGTYSQITSNHRIFDQMLNSYWETSWSDKFLCDYLKMQDLVYTGTIEKDIFNTWLTSAIAKLDSEPLSGDNNADNT